MFTARQTLEFTLLFFYLNCVLQYGGMTSNNPQQQQEQNKRQGSKQSRSEFVTSPIDNDKRNALQDRELRPYLKHSENFNRLVKAGIVLSDGRIVCSDEQWNETREALLKKTPINIYGRSPSTSPETKIMKTGGPGKSGSFSQESAASPLVKVRTRKSSAHQHVENQNDEASQSSDEIWGNTSSHAGTSKERSPSRKGSAYSRESVARHSSQSIHPPGSSKSTSGKARTTKAERASEMKRKLKEKDALNKQRILAELQQDDGKKAPTQDKRQEIKEHARNRNKGNEEPKARRRNTEHSAEVWIHSSLAKIVQADDAVMKTLEQSRDILKMMMDEGRLIRTTNMLGSDSSSESDNVVDNLDSVFFDLMKRQEQLFRALGERNIDDISSLLEFMPAALEQEHKEMYRVYGPHAQMGRMVDDLLCNKITADIFFKEAASLVKLMHPGKIIEHFGNYIASKTGPRRLLKVTSSSSAEDDRFAMSWSSQPPSKEKAMAVASRLVDDTIEHARSVHTYLTEGSGVNLSLLGIGCPDPLTVAQKRFSVGDLTIESYSDEHVSFSERSVICPRPLEEGQSVADLKPVLDRPPTPIPEAERIRRKSRERLEAYKHLPEAKKNARELAEDIRQESEKRLKRRMKQDGLRTGKKGEHDAKGTLRLAETNAQLKEGVYARLAEWKQIERERGKQLARVVESISDLMPHVEGEQRDRFVRNISKQVSSIVGTTLKQARDIMLEAMNMSQESAVPETAEDSDDFESVYSAVDDDTRPKNSAEPEGHAEESQPELTARGIGEAKFTPVFGSKDLSLDSNVISSGLAAISVKHEQDVGRHSHDGHSHAPSVSHMREFFRTRVSMPAISGLGRGRMADKKRHSMPATLPECMDPSKLQSRHSFLSVVRPDVKTLPEYRDKTLRQVESVVQDHSVFGRLQELSPAESDEDELASEELGQADEEIIPKFRREKLPPAPPVDADAQEEAADAVPDLPPIGEPRPDQQPPRAVASTPVAHHQPDPEEPEPDPVAAPTAKTQSLTPSRMMLRCDSDPRLSLRSSTAEVQVDIHQHSALCEDHEAHDEPPEQLEKIESSAFGINAERTASDSQVATVESAAGAVKRSGSADGGPLAHPDVDSDDETELRVRDPVDDAATAGGSQTRYY